MKATVTINYAGKYDTTMVHEFPTIRDAKDYAVHALTVWGTKANFRITGKNTFVVTVMC